MRIFGLLAPFFRNNGHLRGALYVVPVFLTGVLAGLTELAPWLYSHRQHLAEIPLFTTVNISIALTYASITLIGAIVSAFCTWRAYLDQHLSRTSGDELPTSTVTATTSKTEIPPATP